MEEREAGSNTVAAGWKLSVRRLMRRFNIFDSEIAFAGLRCDGLDVAKLWKRDVVFLQALAGWLCFDVLQRHHFLRWSLGSISTTFTSREKNDARIVESKGNAYRTRVENVAKKFLRWSVETLVENSGILYYIIFYYYYHNIILICY